VRVGTKCLLDECLQYWAKFYSNVLKVKYLWMRYLCSKSRCTPTPPPPPTKCHWGEVCMGRVLIREAVKGARCPRGELWGKMPRAGMLIRPDVHGSRCLRGELSGIDIQNVMLRLDRKSNSSVVCMSSCRGTMTAVGFAGAMTA
jgi:hypothetical protein